METDVSREGFGYKYFLVLRKRKVIDFNTVISWQIKNIGMFNDLGGYGYQKAVFKKKSGYIMRTGDVIEFVLKNGTSKVFSTENAAMLESVLRKYIAEKEIK
ncbi:MAG: hypothetical protein H7Y00_04280 [Fimbriimonadaceae bacterium]|nr:hypothetical protein [Chitinophagales bacterium]